MTDLTRAYIEAFRDTISVGVPSEREAAKAITQLLRQLDAANKSTAEAMNDANAGWGEVRLVQTALVATNARADAAVEQMRDRCAVLCDDADPDIWLYHTGNRARYGESDLGKTLRALPIHEEPNNDAK